MLFRVQLTPKMSTSNDIVFDTSQVFSLIQDIDNYLLVKRKEVVVFLGNTGAGKSTLVQLLYGDNSKLKSQETSPESGEYIIKDEENKIGSSILSTTFLANLLTDPKGEICYYDCPGFNDTRNSNFDIAGSYMIKNIVDAAENVKFVFLVNYSSVREGVERADFVNLLTHATEFIKNIANYKTSICLVVTKVDNEYKNKGKTLIPDVVMKDKIITFLTKARETIRSSPDIYTEKNISDFTCIIDIFLQRGYIDGHGEYVNIELFRRPDEGGIISNIESIQEMKPKIKTFIDKIKFSQININDFAFTISDKSKNNINQMFDTINSHMSKIIIQVSTDVKHNLKQRFKNLQGHDNTEKEIKTLLSKFNEVFNILQGADTFKQFINNFFDMLSLTTIKLKKSMADEVESYYNLTNFMFEITNQKCPDLQFSSWCKPLDDITKTLTEALNWNNILKKHFEKISTSNDLEKIQSLTDKTENIRKIKNLQDFIDFAGSDTEMKELYKGIDITADRDAKIEDINRLLTAALTEQKELLEDFCSVKKILILKADFFHLSSLNKYTCKYQSIKEIRILCYNTIYLDDDILKAGEGLNIIIIAPTWQIKGSRKIILDGKAGSAHKDTKAKVEKDGRAGESGGPGGCFFGVVQNILLDGRLEISANGGNGGDGQDGGDGSPGQDALEPDENNLDAYISMSTLLAVDDSGKKRWYSYVLTFGPSTEVYRYSAKGTNGKDGGKGGVGGKGGHKGEIRFFGLENESFSLSCHDGANGKPGVGGKGGKGGKNVETLIEKSKTKMHLLGMNLIPDYTTGGGQLTNSNLSFCEPGKTYSELSFYDFKEPEMPHTITNFDQIIREYKISLFSNNFFNNYGTGKLRNFYDFLNAHPDFKRLVNSKGFLEEFYSLKNYELKCGQKDNLIDTYLSLLYKINEYKKKSKPNEIDLLSFLQAAVLSTIVNFHTDCLTSPVINLEHFTCFTTYLCALEQTKDEFKIEKYFEKYEEQTKKYITETICFTNDNFIYQIEADITSLKQRIHYSEKDEKVVLKASFTDFMNFLKNIIVNILQIGIQLYTTNEELLQIPSNLKCEQTDLLLLVNQGFEIVKDLIETNRNFLNEYNFPPVQNSFSTNYEQFKALVNENEMRKKDINCSKEKQQNVYSLLKGYTYVYQTLIPLYVRIYESIQDNPENAILNISKWKLQFSLKELTLLVKKIKPSPEYGHLIWKFGDTADTLIIIYDEIQIYNEQKQLALYIKDLFVRVQDSTLEQLDVIIKANIVANQYKNALSTFKQYVFPFAVFNLKRFELQEFNPEQDSYDNLIATVGSKIKKMQTEITKNRFVHCTRFADGNNLTGAFYEWDEESHKEVLSDLLSGKKIILTADVAQSIHRNKNAIKFNVVNAEIKTKDDNNDKLQELLNKFQITMSHNGNSRYKYENCIYKVNSNISTFNYSFQVAESKIKDGMFVLSPYATWTFQLKPVEDNGFQCLEKFKGRVRLLLTGFGQYVDDNELLNSEDVQKYYEPIENISLSKMK